MGASLERIPVEHKVEIRDWLVEHLQRAAAASDAQARDTWTLWAIGRIGARAPSTAVRTAWCPLAAPPPGSTHCLRWTGNASKGLLPPSPTWPA
ncbi:hypothetical protein QTI04_28715 [Variovorax sp. J22R115]|nr:hypothetical protein [Variovorax sp. J22R115]